jgi:hypothetical protein
MEGFMKKLLFIAMACAIFAAAVTVNAQAQSFGQLLIECETSVNFSSQSDSWRSRRSGWISQVRSAGDDIDALKQLLIEFETNVKYEAQSDSWREQRSEWLEKVRNASSMSELGQLLIEVETSIKYSAQTSSWRNQRSSWLSRVRSL